MSNYLITPVKGCWKNWQKLAQLSGVEFSQEDRLIGEAIFSHKPNKFPVARPRVLKVKECYSPSNPSTFDDHFIMQKPLPVHPVVLLTLMTGIGDIEETQHMSWTYRMVASTLLLAHPNGQVYTFLIDGGDDRKPKWRGRFLPANDDWIGRSMYIHQYSDKEGFNLYGYFMLNAEGKYGRYITCFD